jgi:hypothetical protein
MACPWGRGQTEFYLTFFAKAQVKYLRAASRSPTDLAKPEFDALMPSDRDLTITVSPTNVATVKYLNVFEYTVSLESDEIRAYTFRH